MNSVISGTKAKQDGHKYEEECVHLLNERFGGDHKTDGRPQTKVDMYEETSKRKYSIKSISKNHTQVALLSTEKFIKHFKIKGHSESFLRMFFGYPNPELKSIVQERHPDLNLSEKEIHQNRVYKNNIEKKVCSSFVTWMNKNKCSIFDVIVRRGFEGDAVDTITDLMAKISKPENNSSHITFVMEFSNRIDSVGMTAKKSGVLDTFKSNVSTKLQMIDNLF